MEWDQIQALALRESAVGFRLACHDPECGRQVWRDFSDFPPTLTLRELRTKARCDTCGSKRGFPLDVWPVDLGSHARDRTKTIEQLRREWRDQELNLLLPYPYGRSKLSSTTPLRPSVSLVDEAHVELGLPRTRLFALTAPQETLRNMFAARDRLGNQPTLPRVAPGDETPIVRIGDTGKRELLRARWGANKAKFGWITTARDLTRRPWSEVLRNLNQRCLIPATAFAAPHASERDEWGRRRIVWFRRKPEGIEASDSWYPVTRPLFAMAGLYRHAPAPQSDAEVDRDLVFPSLAFVMLATEPNPAVSLYQPQVMPVVLREAEFDTWLRGGPEEAGALQTRIDETSLEIGYVGGDADYSS